MFRVVIVGQDGVGRHVTEVHGSPVEAEARAVSAGDAGDDLPHRAVRVESIDGTQRFRLRRAIHAAANKAAVPVAATVVQTSVGELALDDTQALQGAGFVEQGKTRFEADHQSALPPQADGADAFGHGLDPGRGRGRVMAPDLTLVDVDPADLTTAWIPHDALAKAISAIEHQLSLHLRPLHFCWTYVI